ncbi:MAG: type I methionyl aminopeptidase [Lachnospiraceae bacterium]|nr:type I methionyl aminopeptidase [Lachnospiraceae bacterium]
MSVTIKSEHEIELMREAGRILAIVHEEMGKIIRPGISTLDINKKGEEVIRSFGCIPSFLNYNGYPASVCVSVNDEVVHGIPRKDRILQEGDIVSLDAGVIYKGYHSDAARTHAVGQIDEEDEKLIEVTRQSFFEGVKMAKAGNHLFDISKAIQDYAESFGFSVVREMVGHGIGSKLHEEPQIPNFKPIGRGMKLRPGMTLAIEPMINKGKKEIWILDDDWTCVTRDSQYSAHYENTVLITEGEPEILSLADKDNPFKQQ